jgi:hypothetical protein
MRCNRIKAINSSANSLANSGDYEAEFSLRWIAYEGLVKRACVRALWLRGARVKDAEKTLSLIRDQDLTTLLAKCCDSSEFKILSGSLGQVKKYVRLRNSLFHSAVVESKSEMKKCSALLKSILINPNSCFEKISVCYEAGGVRKQTELGFLYANLKQNASSRDPYFSKNIVRAERLLNGILLSRQS